MLDDADERWVAEHGYLAANPLVEEAEHAIEQLRHNPERGVRFRRVGGHRPEIRRLLLQTGWHLYYSVDASRSHGRPLREDVADGAQARQAVHRARRRRPGMLTGSSLVG